MTGKKSISRWLVCWLVLVGKLVGEIRSTSSPTMHTSTVKLIGLSNPSERTRNRN